MIFSAFSWNDVWQINKTFGTEAWSNIGKKNFCLCFILYFLSVLLKSTIDATDFQQLLLRISKEEKNVEVEVDLQEEENRAHNYREESFSDDEDEDVLEILSSSSDESILDL